MSDVTAAAEARMAAALRPFGWTCGPDFWARYHTDPWVFNLANAVERLTEQLAGEPYVTMTGKVLTAVDIEVLAAEAEYPYEVDPALAIVVGAKRRWRHLPNRRGVMIVQRIDTLNRRVLVKWDDRTTDWLDRDEYVNETEDA